MERLQAQSVTALTSELSGKKELPSHGGFDITKGPLLLPALRGRREKRPAGCVELEAGNRPCLNVLENNGKRVISKRWSNHVQHPFAQLGCATTAKAVTLKQGPKTVVVRNPRKKKCNPPPINHTGYPALSPLFVRATPTGSPIPLRMSLTTGLRCTRKLPQVCRLVTKRKRPISRRFKS